MVFPKPDEQQWITLTETINTQQIAMNILIILSHLDQTGMTTNTIDLADGLVRQGHNVTVLVGTPQRNQIEQMLYSRLALTKSEIVCFPHINNNIFSKIISTLSILIKTLSIKADVIHVESPYLTFIPWLLRKRFTSTFHVNDLIPCFYYKNATHLIAISKETKDYAIKHFNYEPSDITIVSHGVSDRYAISPPSQTIMDNKKRYGIPANKIIIGMVASIEYRKGHDILLNAIAQLPDSQKQQVHIVMCGNSKDGKTNEWLEKLIRETNNQNRITLIPYCDSADIYPLFDIFVLPSRLEGFSLVTIEAMLAGNCVIRTNTEGASEQITNGENGYIFQKENISQLSEILSHLIDNPTKIKTIAQRAKEIALHKFTNITMAKNTVKVYNKILSR